MPAKQPYSKIRDMFKDQGYELVTKEEDYKNSTTKVHIICDNGHNHEMYPKDFKNGVRCAKCKGLARHTYEVVKETVEKEGHTLLSGTYTNNRSKLHIICPHGHSMYTSFDRFKRGDRCRRCRSSRGENVIRFILNEVLPSNVEVTEQKSVLYKGKKYAFDFFIDTGRGTYIEYDGEQHFRPVDFWGGAQGFKDQKYRDKQKEEYVKQKGAGLLRIPYTISTPEIYEAIINFLKDEVSVEPLDAEKLSNAEYYGKYTFSMNDVAEFYKHHTVKETAKQFNLNEATVHRYFIQVYGVAKRVMKKQQIKEEMAKYYLTHSNKETQKKYKISDRTLQTYFKEVYGTDKTNYLKSLDSTS
ncbi:homing endonuclease [Bacillus phage Bobb]|uniref:Group I intron protein n=1 Tax=Bacillus phage Bobb TaxID=1527469 RepID=A0A076G7J2_9CAUD|nr:homing endonuclease [Bacillus phage Bobb]AII28086.1 group I intron protein [Bacillus phage Bobb]